MTTAEVSEVPLEDGYFGASFAGLRLIVKEKIGFVNATHLCALHGQKLDRYNESQRAKEIRCALPHFYADLNVETGHSDADLNGTYYHPARLLDVAAWLAPRTYVGAAVVIDGFFNRPHRSKVSGHPFTAFRTVARENDPVYDPLVDERGCFKTWDLCRAHGKTVDEFESDDENLPLVEYLRTAGRSQSAYYHPLLFVRLAAWVDADAYARSAKIVFGCADERLKRLFRRQISSAGLALVGASNEPDGQCAAGELRNREGAEKTGDGREAGAEKTGDGRVTLRRRLAAEWRLEEAMAVEKRLGMGRVECVALFVNANRQVYGCRRRLHDLIRTIAQLAHQVVEFVGWFISCGAARDYDLCAALVSAQAADRSCRVACARDTIALEDAGDETFDLPEAVRRTLRVNLELIEADVHVLAWLFEKPIYGDSARPANVAEGDALGWLFPKPTYDSAGPANSAEGLSEFVERVHKWIHNEYIIFSQSECSGQNFDPDRYWYFDLDSNLFSPFPNQVEPNL